ncbi:30S ribosomal protein S9 [Candidatus Saccharibacteria bacterium RIFCSPHIGHO2_12_FULL_41_12]|nr:MAG: 30S ribosomal protein S9 [Candidatus Saccharibacteria bacterium RIFCSPHIGHO2_12_FULL_41_12]
MTTGSYFYGLGRRKSSTARVRLYRGKGNITINDKSATDYLSSSQYLLSELEKPFKALQEENKFDITIKVSGGGLSGQVQAIRLGISKALVAKDENLRGTLRKADLLGRDVREKERKKPGLKGARKKRQFTKR